MIEACYFKVGTDFGFKVRLTYAHTSIFHELNSVWSCWSGFVCPTFSFRVWTKVGSNFRVKHRNFVSVCQVQIVCATFFGLHAFSMTPKICLCLNKAFIFFEEFQLIFPTWQTVGARVRAWAHSFYFQLRKHRQKHTQTHSARRWGVYTRRLVLFTPTCLFNIDPGKPAAESFPNINDL